MKPHFASGETPNAPLWKIIEETSNAEAIEAFLIYLFSRLGTGEISLIVDASSESMIRHPDGILRVLVDGEICIPFTVINTKGKIVAGVILEQSEAITFMSYVSQRR